MMKKHWLDDPTNIRKLWRGFLAVLVVLVGVELVVALHPHFAIERIYAFHAWYGLLACAVLIVIAKALGVLIKRPDDYYERHDD